VQFIELLIEQAKFPLLARSEFILNPSMSLTVAFPASR
jgi:hypothetical protein